MGHHIDEEGRFQSDKNPELKPDKIVLSFHDEAAQGALLAFSYATKDKELANDIRNRLFDIIEEKADE